MGQVFSVEENAPRKIDRHKPPTFDPMLGFPNGRKERVVLTTEEEMASANVPLDRRDYCIDFYMKFLSCRADHFPLIYKCKHEVHEHDKCEYEDYVLRMKEFERERRLLAREAKKIAKQRGE